MVIQGRNRSKWRNGTENVFHSTDERDGSDIFEDLFFYKSKGYDLWAKMKHVERLKHQ